MSSSAATCPCCETPVAPAMARCRECGTLLKLATSAPATQAGPNGAASVAESSEQVRVPDSKALPRPTSTGTLRRSANALPEDAQPEGSAPERIEARIVRMKCPCGRKFRVTPNWAGRSLKCPKCDRSLKVPETLKGEPEAAEEAGGADFKRLAEKIATEQKRDPPPDLKRTLSLLRWRKIQRALREPGASARGVEIRKEALRQLGTARDKRSMELILAHADDPSPEVREAVAAALGDLEHPATVPPLLRMLHDELAMVRKAALVALGRTRSRMAVRPLLLYAREDPQMRFLACESVSQLGETAVPELLEIVTRNDGTLLLDAVILLGRLRDTRATKAVLGVLNLRLPAEVRRAAADTLGQLGDGRSAAALRALLRDRQPEVRASAVAALVKMPDESNVAALIQALEDDYRVVAERAAAALGEIGDREAVAPLTAMLEDEDEALRFAAAEALAKMGEATALPALVDLLSSEDEKTLLRALAGLKKLRDPAAVGPLLAVLDHERSTVRQRVVDVLGQVGDAEVAERLEVLLKSDRSEEVRAAAARALGEIADPVSVEVLLDALRDDFAVRCRACIALGAIGDEAALPGLLAMLKDSAPEVRHHAATALGEIGSTKAIPALKQHLQDEDTLARRGILKALEDLGEPQDTQALDRRHRWRRTKDAAIYVMAMLPSSPKGWGVIGGALAAAIVVGFVWSGGGSASDGSRVVVRGNVSSVSFGPDGRQLAVGRSFGLIEFWDVEKAKIVGRADLGKQMVLASDGKTIAVVRGTNVAFWDSTSSQSPVEQVGHEKPIIRLAAAPGGKFAATVSGDGVVVVWNLLQRRALSAVQLPAKDVTAYAVSSDGELVASGSAAGSVVLWNSRTAAAVQQFRAQKAVAALAISRDGARIAAAVGHKVAVWDAKTAGHIATLESPRAPQLIAFDSDAGKLLGVSGTEVQLWDLETHELRKLPSPPISDAITTVDFSPDGKQLAVGADDDGGVWVYDLQAGKIAKTLNVKR